MKIQFTGHHIEATPALKEYATEKMQRLTKRDPHISQVNFILKSENHQFSAEAHFHLSGTDFHGIATDADMYAAIDKLIDKLTTQVTKHKEKTTDHR